MKSKKIMALVASAAIASGLSIALPTTVAHADTLQHLSQPVQLVQFNKTPTSTNKNGTVTVSYKIVCDGKVLSTGSSSGVPGTPDNMPVPAIPTGYTLKNITINGSTASDFTTSIPMSFPKSNTEVVYTLIKGVNTYTNSIRCVTAKGKPLAGVKMLIIYSNTEQATVVTNKDGYAPTTNTYQVVSVSILNVPNNYELVGEPYQYVMTSSEMLKNGTTNTSVKANFKFVKVLTGEIKYTVETENGTVLGGGDTKGAIGKPTNLKIDIPKGYEIVRYETSTGQPIKSLPTTITASGVTDYKVIVKSTTPPKPKPEKAILTIKEVGPDGTVYGQSGMTGFIGMQAKAVAPGLPEGFRLVNITCNGKVIDGLPKTLTEPNQTIIYHIERISKPKPVIKTSSITYKVVTETGKVLSSATSNGDVGSTNKLTIPTISKDYKVISITDNGKTITTLPSKFTDDNQNIIYTVKSLASNIQVEYKCGGKEVGSVSTSNGLIGNSFNNIALIPNGLSKDYKVKDITINGKSVGTSLTGQKVSSSTEKIVIELEKVEVSKPVVKPDVPVVKPDVKPESKPDVKPESKPDVKPESKPEPKPIVTPVPKPEDKPVVKPDDKPKTSDTTYTVTAEIIDASTGKVISKTSVVGKTGTELYGPQLNIPYGCKIVSVKENGITVSGIPKCIGNSNETLTILVTKDTSIMPKPEDKPVEKPVKPIDNNKPVVKPAVTLTDNTKPVEKPSDKPIVKPVVKTNNNDVNSTEGTTAVSSTGHKTKESNGVVQVNGTTGSNTNNNEVSGNPKTGDASEAPLAGLIAGSVLALFIANKKYILR